MSSNGHSSPSPELQNDTGHSALQTLLNAISQTVTDQGVSEENVSAFLADHEDDIRRASAFLQEMLRLPQNVGTDSSNRHYASLLTNLLNQLRVSYPSAFSDEDIDDHPLSLGAQARRTVADAIALSSSVPNDAVPNDRGSAIAPPNSPATEYTSSTTHEHHDTQYTANGTTTTNGNTSVPRTSAGNRSGSDIDPDAR